MRPAKRWAQSVSNTSGFFSEDKSLLLCYKNVHCNQLPTSSCLVPTENRIISPGEGRSCGLAEAGTLSATMALWVLCFF